MSSDYEHAGYVGWATRADAEYYRDTYVIPDLADISQPTDHRVRLATDAEVADLWFDNMTAEEHKDDKHWGSAT